MPSDVPMIDRRPVWSLTLWYLVAALLILMAVGPAIWLIVIAFQPPGGELYSLKGGFTLDNFRAAWRDGNLAGPLFNSVLVTIVRAALNVFIAALAAYPLARMRFRGRDTVFVLLLATMMIPEQVIVVPMFRMIVGMGLYDTLIAVVLPFSVTAFGIYLCRQAFLAIPDEVEEAARMDGAGSLRIWWSVILPLSAPTLATLALFSVIGAWSELLWPLIVLQEQNKFTLPVALNNMLSQFEANTRAAYAGAVLSLAPILLLFAIAQRFLKAEIFGGAVKG
ncbi:MAG: carbohydrate ABC transporter permease [Phycisphaerales bacterium]|nr:carbohydrate ABC transporter permease [Phycisphaerales bacterium]